MLGDTESSSSVSVRGSEHMAMDVPVGHGVNSRNCLTDHHAGRMGENQYEGP